MSSAHARPRQWVLLLKSSLVTLTQVSAFRTGRSQTQKWKHIWICTFSALIPKKYAQPSLKLGLKDLITAQITTLGLHGYYTCIATIIIMFAVTARSCISVYILHNMTTSHKSQFFYNSSLADKGIQARAGRTAESEVLQRAHGWKTMWETYMDDVMHTTDQEAKEWDSDAHGRIDIGSRDEDIEMDITVKTKEMRLQKQASCICKHQTHRWDGWHMNKVSQMTCTPSQQAPAQSFVRFEVCRQVSPANPRRGRR